MVHRVSGKLNEWMQKVIRPERVMLAGFLALIIIGTILLSLPVATVSRRSIGVFNSLFTATSAVCVTGLVVVDTGTTFSLFGQLVLLMLIQMGGLGFMIFATMVMVLLGRRISLKNRMMIRESMNTSTLSGLVRLSKWYGLMALVIELIGAALLSIRFIPTFGVGKGIYYAVWHAVSAFCNAGFDLMGGYRSMTQFQYDPFVLLTLSVLVILGGLGFSVILEGKRHHHWREFSLHAHIVLIMTGALLLIGTIFFAMVEWDNPLTLGSIRGAGNKLVNAFFQSMTMRTAGFNSVDLGGMRESSKLLSVILMFIGASPASTGGGVKTTTISVLFLVVLSVIRGQENVNVMNRRLPTALLRRALSILFISLFIMLAGTMALTLCEREGKSFIDLMFEASSAFATVGVSSVGTPCLSHASKCFLIPLMYFGRVGPMTMALALANKAKNTQNHVKYVEENITIG